MKQKYLALGCALVLSSVANADVTYDQDGVGFVGKGDVQTIFDWNNSMLQENASLVAFRMLVAGSATWTCTGVNPAGHQVTQTHSTESQSVASTVSFDVRKNRTGQVTGFVLNGASVGSTSFVGIGQCNTLRNWQVQPSLDVDSLVTESSEPLLQVSIDGMEWHDLPITE